MSLRTHMLGGLLGVFLAACANDMQPAQQAISEVSTLLSSAAAEAREYVPERLAAVQEQLAGLQARYDRKDYAGVIGTAPAVLRAAHELGGAAAAQKAVVTAALNERWAALAVALPAAAARLQARIEMLQKSSGKHRRGAADLDAARATLSEYASTWSKGQAAFATGNMTEAVTIGEGLQGRYEALGKSLGL